MLNIVDTRAGFLVFIKTLSPEKKYILIILTHLIKFTIFKGDDAL